jgi:Uma2 family endonuclease
MAAVYRRTPVDEPTLELREEVLPRRRLGTAADCYDGSPWELHRGELLEQMGSKDIHAIVMALLAALFRTHARPGLTVMTDVYCDLGDASSASLRAPDVVLVGDLLAPRNAAYGGTPILAVEIRGAQSKRYLDEKVKLYLEHAWPCTWVAHAERRELEVVRPEVAPVLYRAGSEVPLPPELDKHGLSAVPVAALFDEQQAPRFLDEWVKVRAQAEERGRSVLEVLRARGLSVPDEVRAQVMASHDLAALERWLVLAATAGSSEGFVRGV